MNSPSDPNPSNSSAPRPDLPSGHTSDHLANERTFLAWIRTSISVIGLGFVVAKFSVWLRELAARLNEPQTVHHSGMSLPLGVGMMTLGGLLAVVASWRYRKVRNAIEQGEPSSDRHATLTVTWMVVAIAVALIIYMLATQ